MRGINNTKMKKSSSRKKGDIFKYIVMYLTAAIILIPFLHMFLSCFKTNEEINRVALLPSALRFDNFRAVFEDGNVLRSFWNSFVTTVTTMLLSVVICSMAAYSISRHKSWFFRFLYFFFLSAMMIPAATTLIPIYTMMQEIGLINSLGSLLIMYTSGTVGMGILLYTGFIKGIPRELEEAASIDGCGFLNRFYKVVFPLLKPVNITFIVLNTITVWNDFLYPLLFISSKAKQPLTLLVYTFRNERGSDWGAIYALLVIAALGPIIFYFLMQKHFEEGMTIGAIKG